MLAMLRKDWYVMGKYTAVFIAAWMVIAGMLAWIPGAERSFLFYTLPVVCFGVTLNAIGVDHDCRWDRFAAMTLLRPWELVLEKYLLSYGILALIAGLGALAGRISTMGQGGNDMWATIVLVLLATATALPLVYRFGQQKGRLILLGFWGLVAALILGAAHWNYALIEAVFGWMDAAPVPALAAGIAAVLLAANAASICLSIRFYTRRQRGWYD